MARAGEERSDSSVSSVRASSASWGSVHLNVAQDELLGLEGLDLRVGFEVSEQIQNDLDGFCRPSSLGHSELLRLSSSTSGTSVSSVRDASLVFKDLSEVFLGSLDGHTLQGASSVVGVLEVSSEVVAAGLNSFVRPLYLPLSGLAGSLANFFAIPLY